MGDFAKWTAWTALSYIVEQCCVCGVRFAMEGYFVAERKKTKDLFYCPNGHQQHYTTSEADELRKQLAEAESRLDAARCQRDQARKQVVAMKGQATKLRNRIAALS